MRQIDGTANRARDAITRSDFVEGGIRTLANPPSSGAADKSSVPMAETENAAPVITGVEGRTLTISEGYAANTNLSANGYALSTGTTLGFTDADDTDYSGGRLVVGLSDNADPAYETLGIAGELARTLGVTWTDPNRNGTRNVEPGSIISVGGVAIATVTAGGYGAAGADLVIEFNADATTARVQTLFEALGYINNSENPDTDPRTLTITLTDPHGASSSAALTITNVPVNDAPTLRAFNWDYVWVEGANQPSTPIAPSAAVVVNDYQEGDIIRGRIEIVGGTSDDVLSFVNDDPELYGDIVATFADGVLSFSTAAGATGAQWQNAFRAVTYNNLSEDPSPSPIRLQYWLQDSHYPARRSSDSTYIYRYSANDSPSGTSATITIDEDAPRVLTIADFGYSDVEGHALAAVTITSIPLQGTLTLDSDGAGGGDPVAVTAGQAISAADIAAGRLVFTPASNGNGADYASFSFQVRDDDGTANGGIDTDPTPDTIRFDVTPVNDAPVLGVPEGISLTIREGLAREDLANGAYGLDRTNSFTLTDPDGGDFAGGEFRVTLTGAGNDTEGFGFEFASRGGRVTWSAGDSFGPAVNASITVDGVTIGTVTANGRGGTDLAIALNSNATAARVEILLQDVGYLNSSGLNDPSPRTVTITVSDGDGGSASVALTLINENVNNPPSFIHESGVIDGNRWVEASNAPSTPVAISNDLRVTDADGDALPSARVQINNRMPGDVLDFINDDAARFGNIAVVSFVDGVLELASAGGTATYAQWSAALNAVTFNTTEQNPGGDRNISYFINDGIASRRVITILTVDAVNDTPTGSDGTITLAEDGAAVLNVSDFGFVDVDGDALASVVIATLPVAGALTLNGVAVIAGQSIAVADIVAGQLVFTPAPDGNGENYASFTFQVRDNGGTANGGIDLDPTPNRISFDVTPVIDPSVAIDDQASVAEDGIIAIAVAGNDSNGENGAEAISQIDGQTIAPGGSVTLASGAVVTLNADGRLSYDPNHRFDALISAERALLTGASNTSASDSFTYTLSGGNSAAVTVTITGVDGASDQLIGGAVDDVLTGSDGGDFFRLDQGGADTAHGGQGDDAFLMGAALDAEDRIDGGAGANQLAVQGDTSVTLGDATVRHIASMVFLSGADTRFGLTGNDRFSYSVTTADGTIAAGQVMQFNANMTRADESVLLDASAESDGAIIYYAGLGDDRVIGGAGADAFFFGSDGRFAVTDRIDGGAGEDQLALRGDYSAPLVFLADTMRNIETLALMSSADLRLGGGVAPTAYDLTLHDANVAAGAWLTINANLLTVGETARVDGSAETDGRLRFIGGAGDDHFIGGGGDDAIYGRLGQDVLTGGGGADIFYFRSTEDSRVGFADHVTDFTPGDHIDLSMIDADLTQAGNAAFAFIGDAAFGNVAGQLRATFDGQDCLVEGDVDGDGAADFAIRVTTTSGHVLGADDFFL